MIASNIQVRLLIQKISVLLAKRGVERAWVFGQLPQLGILCIYFGAFSVIPLQCDHAIGKASRFERL